MTRVKTVLVADDDRAIRTVVTQALTRGGFDVRATGNAATLWAWVQAGLGDVVVTDVIMPDQNGLDLLPLIRQVRPDLPVIVMSAQNTLTTAVRATERGAYDYIPKPFDINVLKDAVTKAVERERGPVVGEALSEEEDLPLVGRSPAMQDVYRTMARLMPTDLTVMITGESGTGKELIAKALHDLGKRKGMPFVAINMAAIPRELIESELFGHEKGAFTGADAKTKGRFEQAQGGTLFLDEIGDMPIEAQTRLLRVLQQGEYTTVGGARPIKADVRIIAATNKDLRVLIRQGQFREDLFYRLNVVPVRLPALRQRADDVPELARHFLRHCSEQGLPQKTLSQEAVDVLTAYPWPGNVRELENLIRRLCVLCIDDVIDAASVARELADGRAAAPRDPMRGPAESLEEAIERQLSRFFDSHGGTLPANGLYDRVLRELERPLITLTLGATNGNQIRAAEVLGLNRNTLRKKIRELGLEVVRGKN